MWRPALEIFILAVLIYFVFKFVRGTRGWPVVIGFVVVLLALSLVTTMLKLQVLRWLLARFSTFFAVAVLIIFQPELRRMLAELGNLPLFATAQRAARKHRGHHPDRRAPRRRENRRAHRHRAIHPIAGGRRIQLPVDCDATPEMLETIFFPNNAIHDGGVIIKGDRIAYAACIFPLTQRQDLNKSLGTRHRAAIGLSEETDAVIVVVSEETGMISYAYKGQLVRGVTLEELRSFLTSVLLQPAKSHASSNGFARGSMNLRNSGPAVITRNEPRPAAKPTGK